MHIERAKMVLLLLAVLEWPAELPAGQRTAQRVELREAVGVGGENILLSDLLPTTAPAALRARTAEIVVGNAPQPGSLQIIKRAQLERWLRNTPDLRGTLRIPERITVGRLHRRLSHEEILKAIRVALQRNGSGDTVLLSGDDLQLAAPIVVTQDDPGLKVTQIKFDPLRQQTRFRLWPSKEHKALAFYVMVRVRTTSPVVVARRNLRPGEETSEADFRVERRAETHNFHLPPVTPEELAGHRPRRQIKGGQIVKPGMFYPLVLVEPGKLATMVVDGNGFRISTTVLPLQSGVRGQQIRVRNLNTQRILLAEVIAPGYLRTTLRGSTR